ncbi:hypothetical protein GQ42DRAFT_16286 [Ramicandelaber brevisporus]|nr:hypothetical protein GQ42DRAFT_16286 [Ramicandelaber brevisporus]
MPTSRGNEELELGSTAENAITGNEDQEKKAGFKAKLKYAEVAYILFGFLEDIVVLMTFIKGSRDKRNYGVALSYVAPTVFVFGFVCYGCCHFMFLPMETLIMMASSLPFLRVFNLYLVFKGIEFNTFSLFIQLLLSATILEFFIIEKDIYKTQIYQWILLGIGLAYKIVMYFNNLRMISKTIKGFIGSTISNLVMLAILLLLTFPLVYNVQNIIK